MSTSQSISQNLKRKRKFWLLQGELQGVTPSCVSPPPSLYKMTDGENTPPPSRSLPGGAFRKVRLHRICLGVKDGWKEKNKSK